MPSFRHKRTGRVIEVPESDAFRFRTARYEETTLPAAGPVPSGTVAEVLAWVGIDDRRRAAALAAEKAGKKRKGVLEALS